MKYVTHYFLSTDMTTIFCQSLPPPPFYALHTPYSFSFRVTAYACEKLASMSEVECTFRIFDFTPRLYVQKLEKSENLDT